MEITDPPPALRRAHDAYRHKQWTAARKLLNGLLRKAGERADALHLLGLVEQGAGNTAASIAAFQKAARLRPSNGAVFRDWADLHQSRGEFEEAERVLRSGISLLPTDRNLLAQLGHLKREEDKRDEAAMVFEHLLKGDPGDTSALLSRALVELERGGKATPWFARCLQGSPGDRRALLGAASALHQEGDLGAAIALLKASAISPPWPEGLRLLARLQWERGDGETFTSGFQEALARAPAQVELWAHFLGTLASGLHFGAVLRHLDAARRSAGLTRTWDLFEAQALSETGNLAAADTMFRKLGPLSDPSFLPVKLRFLLRSGRYDEAVSLGERAVEAGPADQIWPLLGLAWRKTGSPKWWWLEDYERFVGVIDLPVSASELQEIAQFIRRLHRGGNHPYDQSARSGTQTSGNLFSRTDPPVTKLRALARDAVQEFIGGLPAPDQAHPFLRRPRGAFKFAGSWSIRLEGGGHHVSHVHPAGWISSACYLALPKGGEGADANEASLALGGAPPELELDLQPVRMIRPAAGRLVLFPSIMWHGTVPYPAGERLTAAFDIVPYGA